jgi:hypothetical protein
VNEALKVKRSAVSRGISRRQGATPEERRGEQGAYLAIEGVSHSFGAERVVAALDEEFGR